MIKDVLVQIENFYSPVNFIVIDTVLTKNAYLQIPVILGCPFFSAANVVIIVGMVQLNYHSEI